MNRSLVLRYRMYLIFGTAAPLLRELLDVEDVTDYVDSVYTREQVCSCVQAVCGQVPAALLAECNWKSDENPLRREPTRAKLDGDNISMRMWYLSKTLKRVCGRCREGSQERALVMIPARTSSTFA